MENCTYYYVTKQVRKIGVLANELCLKLMRQPSSLEWWVF